MDSLWWIIGGLVGLLTALVIGLSIRAKALLDAIRTVGVAAKEVGQGVVILLHMLRALIVIIAGVAVLIVGLIMIVTPGPGMLMVIAGLAILGTELVWARRLMVRLRHAAGDLGDLTGVTRETLPVGAGPVRRFVFHIGRAVRWVADRVGMSWLTRKLADRIDRISKSDASKEQPPGGEAAGGKAAGGKAAANRDDSPGPQHG